MAGGTGRDGGGCWYVGGYACMDLKDILRSTLRLPVALPCHHLWKKKNHPFSARWEGENYDFVQMSE